MAFFDLVLVVIVAGFGLFGLWFGLIHTLGSLLGTILGVFLATRFYSPMADWLMNLTGWQGNFPRVVMFVLTFIIINRLVGLLFWIIDKLLSFVTKLPFISGLNRLLGLVFGVLEGVLVLGIIFYFIARFPLGTSFMASLGASKIAPYTVSAATILWPFIPEAIRIIQSSIKGIF